MKYFRVRTYKANIIENHLSSLTIQYREKAYWHLFPPHFGIHTKANNYVFFPQKMWQIYSSIIIGHQA